MVDQGAQRAREHLLGIRDQQRLGLGPEARDRAACEGRLDPVVEARELQDHHAAAGLAGDTDSLGIDRWMHLR